MGVGCLDSVIRRMLQRRVKTAKRVSSRRCTVNIVERTVDEERVSLHCGQGAQLVMFLPN